MFPILGANLWVRIGLGAIVFISIFGMGTWSGYKLGNNKYESLKLEVAQQEVARVTEYNRLIAEQSARTAEVESAYQEEIARLKTRVRTITKEVVREVEKPVYRECVLPESGRMLLDDAVRAANAATGTDGEVPPSPEPISHNDGGSVDFFN